MEKHHDIGQLKRLYLQGYEEAMRTGSLKLETYLEDWKETLNEIEFKFYSDLKSIGVMLYPYYPFDDIVIDFANPFAKVAVVIHYKKTDDNSFRVKIDFLKKFGWHVYVLESKAVTFSANDLYKRMHPSSYLNLDEIDHEDFKNFIFQYSEVNSECLLYRIQEKHFPL